MERIGIVGGGAWGTALAQAARRAGRTVTLWAREAEVVEAINARHENPLFLAGVALDAGIRATSELAGAADADAVLSLPRPSTRAASVATSPETCAPGRLR